MHVLGNDIGDEGRQIMRGKLGGKTNHTKEAGKGRQIVREKLGGKTNHTREAGRGDKSYEESWRVETNCSRNLISIVKTEQSFGNSFTFHLHIQISNVFSPRFKLQIVDFFFVDVYG